MCRYAREFSMTREAKCPRALIGAILVTAAFSAPGRADDTSPEPTLSASGSTSSTGTSAACFDLAPAQGKTIELTRRATDFDLNGEPTETTSLPEVSVIGGEVEFENHMATETLTTYTPVNSPAYTNKEYSRVTGPAELTQYGGLSELVTAMVQSRSKSVFSPPLVLTLDRVPGVVGSRTFTMVVSTTINGVEQQPLTITGFASATLIGFEKVTIPAGTFDACRFEQKHQGPDGPTTTRWLLLGHGVELKASTPAFGDVGASIVELTSLLINGVVPK